MTRRIISKPAIPANPELVDAVTSLAGVLEAENQALRRSDFAATGGLADAKHAAIIRLEAITNTCHAQAGQLSPALHNMLERAIDDNRALLRRSIETQQRVIATIFQALVPERPDHHYPTHTNGDVTQRITAPIALTFRA